MVGAFEGSLHPFKMREGSGILLIGTAILILPGGPFSRYLRFLISIKDYSKRPVRLLNAVWSEFSL
jgi:hypothetical protein